MRKIVLLFALTLSVCNLAFADYDREWSEKRLTWKDFKPAKTDSLGRTSFIYVGISQLLVMDDNGDWRDTYVIDMSTNDSWYDPDKVTDWDLRYNQILFDMAEVSIRKALEDYHRHEIGIYDIFRQYYYYYNTSKERLANENNNGKDTTIIKNYEKLVAQELEQTQSVDMCTDVVLQVPSFRKTKTYVALLMGYENSTFTGNFSDDFKTFHGLNLGFYFPVRSFQMELSCSIMMGRQISSDFYYDRHNGYNWKADDPVNELIFRLGIGKGLYSNDILRVSPIAGMSFSRMQQGTGEKNVRGEIMSNTTGGFGYYLGLDTDMAFKKLVDVIPLIKCRISYSNRNYDSIGSMGSLNLGLSFCIL